MRKILFVGGAFMVALLLAFRHAEQQKKNTRRVAYTPGKESLLLRCSPNWEELKDWLEEADIPPIPGAGNHVWPIRTKSDSAQFYFNQGINMYYGFHIIEAMASFKKAEKFDPDCGMIYWAEALAYGPNINDYGYAASPEALRAVSNALRFKDSLSGREKLLVFAQVARYSDDSTRARSELNSNYVARMKEVYERYPNDADVSALYADAMMLEHPWDLWNVNGTPKPWTPLIREVLEKTLAQAPDHPGSNHYYIHVMEPSPFPEKALASAARLGNSNPGLAHLVHMPSHIYLRTGRYQQGVNVNTNALNSHNKVVSLFAPAAGADFLYVIHTLHMKSNNAMMVGSYSQSIAAARETVASIPAAYLDLDAPMGNYVQYIHSTPVIVNVRFGKWDDLLKMNAPDRKHVFSSLLYHFGRGMALSGQGKTAEAKTELSALQVFLKDSSLLIPYTPFSPLIESALVAEGLLDGSIKLKEGKTEAAIAAFTRAVTREQNMVYNEPRDWLLNPKHYLGNAFLKAGKLKEAKAVFEKDMKNNRENGWALSGLWQAASREKNPAAVAGLTARHKKAFYGADVKLGVVVFD